MLFIQKSEKDGCGKNRTVVALDKSYLCLWKAQKTTTEWQRPDQNPTNKIKLSEHPNLSMLRGTETFVQGCLWESSNF